MVNEKDSNVAVRLYNEALRVLEVLELAGFAARLAGGCVRDRLLGIAPADFDVATNALPQQVMQVFKTAGLRTVPTGLEHGTVTLVMPSGPVEITTLRTDVKTDGRHAEVAFGSSFEEDAARRDFTINALFEDRQGQIYDFFGGRDDLKQGLLRFVGDPERRIREDYLRILRFFRFQARFGYQSAPGTLEAIIAHRQGLARISQERITSELLKTVVATEAVMAWREMQKCQILEIILPEFAQLDAPSPADLSQLRRSFSNGQPPADLCLAYFLLNGQRTTAEAVNLRHLAQRMRLPNRDAEKLAFAAEALQRVPTLSGSPRHAVLNFIDECEKAGGAAGAFTIYFRPLLNALGVDVGFIEHIELLYGHLRRARLPVDGLALQKNLGIPPGAELGRILELLRCEFRDGLWHTAEAGLARAHVLHQSSKQQH